MNRRSVVLAGLLALPAAAVAGGPAASPRQHSAQDRPSPVRVAVDIIPVDVQVLDRDGRPVLGLGPEKFAVTINGQRRRVISAEFIQTRTPGAVPPSSPDVRAADGQVIVLAIDCISFSTSVVLEAIQAARDFIARLTPDVRVGLFAFPVGPDIDPTTDHAAIIRAFSSVVGQRDAGMRSQFRVRPAEIIDISTELPEEEGPILTAIARRECGVPIDLGCRKRLIQEVSSAARDYEAQANVSLGGLRSLLRKMASYSGRKTLVLLSGGVVASDRPGGRPDVASMGTDAGKDAARANTAIYTVHVDTSFEERNSAETRTLPADLTNIGRDGDVRGRWLEQFSGAAGGTLFKVITGRGEYAYTRILTETSSYYLLAVAPVDADRTGLTQEIKVRVNQRNVTVRSRRWVAIPKSRASTAPAAIDAPALAPAGPTTTTGAPAPRVVAREVQPLADAYERGDYDEVERQLNEGRNLASLILALRSSDPPWPDAPQRAAVFALEVAVAGLRSDNGFALDQGMRLLAEYNVRVRQPRAADAFECSWLWAEAAALGGLFRPGLAIPFVRRALLRCPDEPRLHLADGIIAEQQWSSASEPAAEETADVLRRYEVAMTYPETALEARMRGAAFLLRTGRAQQALELLDGGPDIAPSDDTYVRYLADLVRGRVLGALGRTDAAIAAVRSALIAWPAAQSARVALMTLLVNRGDRHEAAALAEAIQSSPAEDFDPWWTQGFGDFRAYPTILDRLRTLAR
jgi:VWFA-related protein